MNSKTDQSRYAAFWDTSDGWYGVDYFETFGEAVQFRQETLHKGNHCTLDYIAPARAALAAATSKETT